MTQENREIRQISYGMRCKSATDAIKIQDRTLLRQAIRQFNTVYYPNVKRYIASRIDFIEDVEDLTQSVFLEFYRRDYNDKEYQSAEAYLLKIARNLIALYYRNRSRQPKTISMDSIGEIAVSDTTEYDKCTAKRISPQELTEIIEIAGLSPKDRQALHLIFIKKHSTKEAAQKAGCSIWTFYKRIDKATKLLEDAMKRKGMGWPPVNSK
ncbi:MAG: RNA polymerase sigma factor [Planctomycetota bacterium]